MVDRYTYCVWGSVFILSEKAFEKETDSTKIYAYSALCLITFVTETNINSICASFQQISNWMKMRSSISMGKWDVQVCKSYLHVSKEYKSISIWQLFLSPIYDVIP